MRRPFIPLGFVALVAAILTGIAVGHARQAPSAVGIDPNDIGGVVRSAKGPEAGVWVIAETYDLPTGHRKIVVTDDQGRYLLPDLPAATYTIWVRGYGLVDSAKVTSTPGKTLDLTAVIAPNALAAAQYYPPQYWYSMVQPPAPSEFPGTGQGPKGNGISERMRNQQEYLGEMRNKICGQCHPIGSKHTREMPTNLGPFESTFTAWEKRVQRGQWGAQMMGWLTGMGRRRTLQMYADWTDRVVAGELPPVPPRPQGIERNIVVTQWDWAKDTSYVHDNMSTDPRNPTLNGYGPIYASEEMASENIHILDPIKHTYTAVQVPAIQKDKLPPRLPASMAVPSQFYGEEIIWTARVDTHTPMMDQKGRVWFTSRRPAEAQPKHCTDPAHPSAKLQPMRPGGSAAFAVYDPKTKEFISLPVCNLGGHLNFAEDADNTLWTTTQSWFKTSVWDKTKDAAQADGWTALVADTNGNGKRDDPFVELDDPLDPTKDHEIIGGSYGVIPSPVDGSIWGSRNDGYPGGYSHLIPGKNPPQTALAEFFEYPLIDPAKPERGYKGYNPRGIHVDRNGVVWSSLSMGGVSAFDRRKCKNVPQGGALRGPKAMDYQSCPEGWTIYPSPGPNFKGVTDPGSADFHYWAVVDQRGFSGLGTNIPFINGGNSDSLLALVDGKWVIFRVPYPMGFFSKGLDGRIDDPKAGWKGRGVWASVNSFAAFHQEGGKSQRSKLMHFQVRPDPLAK